MNNRTDREDMLGEAVNALVSHICWEMRVVSEAKDTITYHHSTGTLPRPRIGVG